MANILVVGPHPDDQELGMGATIALLARQGHDVLLLDMTNGEPTPYGDPKTRAEEAAAAAAILSPDPDRYPDAKPIRRVLLGLPNREVVHSVEARHKVAGVIRAHQATIVFCPYPEDAHPDHLATTRIVEDARFDAKLTSIDMPLPPRDGTWGCEASLSGDGAPIYPRWLFYYYCTHLRHVAQPSFITDVSGLMDLKRRAIEAYRTQFVLPEKNHRIVEWVSAAGVYFGSRIGTEAGEPFFTKEPVGMTGLESLPM
jgi:bacillithiol biosynthesis deacetylase BshB1